MRTEIFIAPPFAGTAAGAGGAPGAVVPVPEYLCFVSMVTVGVPPSVWRAAITQRIS